MTLVPRTRIALVLGLSTSAAAGVVAAAVAADGQPVPAFAGGAPAAYVPGSLDPGPFRFNGVTVAGGTTPSGGAVIVATTTSASTVGPPATTDRWKGATSPWPG